MVQRHNVLTARAQGLLIQRYIRVVFAGYDGWRLYQSVTTAARSMPRTFDRCYLNAMPLRPANPTRQPHATSTAPPCHIRTTPRRTAPRLT